MAAFAFSSTIAWFSSTFPDMDISSTFPDIITCDHWYTMTCNNAITGYHFPGKTECITFDLSSPPEDVQFSDCESTFDTKMSVYADILDLSSVSDAWCDGDDCGSCPNGENWRENFILPNLENSQYTIVLQAFSPSDQGSFKVNVNCGDQIEFEYPMFSSTFPDINHIITCDHWYTMTCNNAITGYHFPGKTECITFDLSSPPEDVQFSDCESTFDTKMSVYADILDLSSVSDAWCDGDDCGSCPNGKSLREHFILPNLENSQYTIVLQAFSSSAQGSFKVNVNCGDQIEYPMFSSTDYFDFSSTMEYEDETSTEAPINTETTTIETTTTETPEDLETTTTADHDYSCSNAANYEWVTDIFDSTCQLCISGPTAQNVCKAIINNVDEKYINCFKEACPNVNCEVNEMGLVENNPTECNCETFSCVGNSGYKFEMDMMVAMLCLFVFVMIS